MDFKLKLWHAHQLEYLSAKLGVKTFKKILKINTSLVSFFLPSTPSFLFF